MVVVVCHTYPTGIECRQYQDRHIVRPRCANPWTGIGYQKTSRHQQIRLVATDNEHPNVSLTVFMEDDFVRKIAQYVKLEDPMGWKMDSGKVE